MNGTLDGTHSGDGRDFPPLSEIPLFDVPPNRNAESCISTEVIYGAIRIRYQEKPENQGMYAFLESLETHTAFKPIIQKNLEKWNKIKMYSDNRNALSDYIRDFVLTYLGQPVCSHEFIILAAAVLEIVPLSTLGVSERVCEITAGSNPRRRRRHPDAEIIPLNQGNTEIELQESFNKHTISSFNQFCSYLFIVIKTPQAELNIFIDAYLRSLSNIWKYSAIVRVYLEFILATKEKISPSERRLIEYFRQHPL